MLLQLTCAILYREGRVSSGAPWDAYAMKGELKSKELINAHSRAGEMAQREEGFAV